MQELVAGNFQHERLLIFRLVELGSRFQIEVISFWAHQIGKESSWIFFLFSVHLTTWIFVFWLFCDHTYRKVTITGSSEAICAAEAMIMQKVSSNSERWLLIICSTIQIIYWSCFMGEIFIQSAGQIFFYFSNMKVFKGNTELKGFFFPLEIWTSHLWCVLWELPCKMINSLRISSVFVIFSSTLEEFYFWPVQSTGILVVILHQQMELPSFCAQNGTCRTYFSFSYNHLIVAGLFCAFATC